MNDACVCIDVDEFPDAHWELTPVAKKEHKCIECQEIIRIGERHEKHVQVFEGGFQTFRTCAICAKIRQDYFKCGWYYGEMWQDLADAWEVEKEVLLGGEV